MSSYTVSRTAIDALVTAAVKWADETGTFRYYWPGGVGRVTPETATSVGQMLWSANWHHADGWVDDTEPDAVPEPVYEYEPLAGVPDPLIVLRLVDNYVYQSAGEPDEWRPTEPFGFVTALQSAATARLLADTELPWTIGDDDRDVFLRYGTPDPAPGPADADNPAWVAIDEKLAATGIPFKSYSPKERGPGLAPADLRLEGRWASWPPDLGGACIMVSLYGSDAEAARAFTSAMQAMTMHMGPRWSHEVMRIGRIVVALHPDHWNADLDPALNRMREVFDDPDDFWRVSRVRRMTHAPIVIRAWRDDRACWEATRDGEPTLTGVQDLADAHRAAEQREVLLLIDGDVYTDMVQRGDAPPDRPDWAMWRPTGGPRLPPR